MLLSLIIIGSTTAFNAILSLATLALYVSYLIPIFLILLKRLRREHITMGPWSLGRFGIYVNVFAIVYGVFICIFLPFPSVVPVTDANLNYAGPVFGAILLFALGDWFVRGRHTFAGPIKEALREEYSD